MVPPYRSVAGNASYALAAVTFVIFAQVISSALDATVSVVVRCTKHRAYSLSFHAILTMPEVSHSPQLKLQTILQLTLRRVYSRYFALAPGCTYIL